MKKRIFRIICAVLLVFTLFGTAVTSAFAAGLADRDAISAYTALSGSIGSVKTGDARNIIIPVIVIAVSMLAIVLVVISKKKKP